MQEEVEKFVQDFTDQVCSDGAKDSLQNLGTLAAEIKEDAGVAKVYVVEAFLLKGLAQLYQARDANNQPLAGKALALIKTEHSFVSSNKLGVTAADVEPSLLKLASKALQ